MLAASEPSGRPLIVENVPGQGGAVAFTRVTAEMVGDEDVIVAASPSTLLGLAQHKFGKSDERSVRWVASVGAEPSVIAVRSDAPWRTFAEFVEAWRANPEGIVSGGGSALGGQDHMKMLVLARAVGIDVSRVRYRAHNGPVEAINSMLADTVQVFPGDASEVQRMLDEGKIRVLAVLASERAAGSLSDVPTAREQGVDVTWTVWRGFYAPPGISDSAYAAWVDRLSEMVNSPAWNEVLRENGLNPYFLAGERFDRFVREQTEEFRAASREIGLIP